MDKIKTLSDQIDLVGHSLVPIHYPINNLIIDGNL